MRVRPSLELVQARKAEIRQRYRRRSSKAHTAPQIAALRLADLAKLFHARYGHVLPDDDAGRDDLQIALAHLATLSRARHRMVQYCALWAPWLTMQQASTMMAEAFSAQQTWTADQLAWRLRLTMADRTTLGITTIGAVDYGKTARTRLRKAKAQAREKARRMRLKAACAP